MKSNVVLFAISILCIALGIAGVWKGGQPDNQHVEHREQIGYAVVDIVE